MSGVALYDEEPQSVTDRLLEVSWEGRERHASQRELIVDATGAALFLAAAAGLLLSAGAHGLRTGIAVLLIAVYAVVGRIEFPVGAGYVVPTQLVLVPMLLMLPPAVVPLAVAAGLVIGNAVECALHRVAPRRVLSAVPDAWHAIGPAAVLLVAGSPRVGFDQLPLLALALAAGCIVDLITSIVRVRLAGVVPELCLQLRVFALVWAVDACLAPTGFLAALVGRAHTAAIVFVLPLAFLLGALARDRSRRIDQAYRRLKLVEQERARLQAAVRRLGDAFAAKLELGGLLEILLQGSADALDAAAGRLELAYGPSPLLLVVGAERWMDLLEFEMPRSGPAGAAVQVGRDGAWRLSVPMRIAAAPHAVSGSLRLIRSGRAFDDVEIGLISELTEKAELSAAEIIAHYAIREQAMTDALTGLGNRRRLIADLNAAFAQGAPETPSLLLMFDLDGFKDYNDTFGHVAGDALLHRLGAKLQRAVDGVGRAYRLGGDEFCAHVGLGVPDTDAVIAGAAQALTETGVDFSIRASLGVVLLPHEADSAERSLQLADERMYADKRSRSTAARKQASEVLVRAMRAQRPDLDEHASAVADLAVRVGQRLGLGREALDDIATAAQLHDVGQLGVPAPMLAEPSRLDEQKWAGVRERAALGERILDGAPALRGTARVVRSIRERWDGLGFPDRLRGEEIPLSARIVSVCDAYDEMRRDRPERAAMANDLARGELMCAAGSQFDPAVVEALLRVLDAPGEVLESDAAQQAAAHVRSVLASSFTVDRAVAAPADGTRVPVHDP